MSSIQIVVDADSVTYTDGVPRMDILGFQELALWASGGVAFMSRADACELPGPTGYKARWTNQIPGGTAVARVADTAVGTLTLKDADAAYLGGQKTIELSDNTDLKMTLSSDIIPATGPFSIYVALHAFDDLFQVGGNAQSGKLSMTLVGTEIRFAFNNTTATVAANLGTGNNVRNRDILIGFIRTSTNYLRIRYKLRGAAWVEVDSAAAFTTTLDTDLSFGGNRVVTNYSANGRWGAMLLATADLSSTIRGYIEDYLVNYYGM